MARSGIQPSVNLNDVAKAARVSPALVSRVLSGRLGNVRVSQATQEKVRQAASRLGYIPRRYAQNLARQRSRTIALLSPCPAAGVRGLDAMGNHYLHQILEGIETECAAHGYNTLYSHWSMPPSATTMNQRPGTQADGSREHGGGYPRIMLDRSVDGVILADYTSSSVVRYLAEAGIRCAQVGSNIDAPDFHVDRYYGDLEEAMRQTVAHLHALGHRRVALFAPQGPGPRLIEQAFMACQQQYAGLALRSMHVGPVAVDDGVASLQKLLAEGFAPQAMICPHVKMASHFAALLAEKGCLCPRDYSLICWSLAGWPATYLPGSGYELATIELSNYEVARHATRDMIEALERRDDAPPRTASRRAFDHPWPCDIRWGQSISHRPKFSQGISPILSC